MPKRKPRSDGRYQAKLLVGVIDGQPKYKYVYGKTQKEVNDKLAELRVQLGQGADLTQPMALSVWIRRWLAREEQQQTDSWYALCEVRAKYWEAALGDRDISRITAADLEDVLIALARCNPRTGKPSSKKTLNEYRAVIARVFALALQCRVLTFDPTQYLTTYKNAPQSHRDALTDAQIALIRQTPHECQLPCLLMIYCGLRYGELAALTWSDVDLTAQTISVNKSYDTKQGRVKPPKTAAGVRTVPIPDLLAAILAEQQRTSLFVCPHNGQMWSYGAWSTQLPHYLSPLGITTTAHCFRHTYATILYEAGVDVLTAQRWLGHADAQTTMNIYTHLRDQHQSAAVLSLNDYISPKKKSKGVSTVSE